MTCGNFLENLQLSNKEHHILASTPWKIDMEPENDGLEDDFPFQTGDF